MAPLLVWKAKALEGTEHLNPGLVLEPLGPVYKGKVLAASAERVQLFFKAADCDKGTQHLHSRTPHGVKKPKHLRCVLCPRHVASRVQFETERQVIEHVRESRDGDKLLLGVVCQWCPPWWDGRVDFYHYPTETIIQVDGPPHFEGLRKQQPCMLLLNDLECCCKVWEQQGRILRIHHLDIEAAGDLVHEALDKKGAFIALSPAFAHVGFVHGGQVWSYKSNLVRQLGCPAVVDNDNTIWFSPLTL